MPTTFPIIEVTSAMRSDVEQLGSKPKFWFKLKNENWLFKEARANTGEDWSEKVASEIASLLGIPAHHTELAIWEGKRGCAVKSFLAHGQAALVHGNELLGGLITGYDAEKQRGQADHTFDNIVLVIERLFPHERARIATARRIAGYLVLDALVGNTDRHHQNWGVILEPRLEPGSEPKVSIELAPSFDHASSLGRELTDAARERHIQEATIERYIRRGRGGIFADPTSQHGLSPIALAHHLAQHHPLFFKPWQKKVAELSSDSVRQIVERVPTERMSEPAQRFTLAFLEVSRQLLTKVL